MEVIARIRRLFAASPDPYAGADLKNAQRFGALFWALTAFVLVCVMPLSPPTVAIGTAGWAVAAVLVAGSVALSVSMKRGYVSSWESMLLFTYVTAIGIGTMQILAGGSDAAYGSLLVLNIGFVAALHPPRQMLAFIAAVLALLVLPVAIYGWQDSAAGAFSSFIVWVPLGFMVSHLMEGVRSQRLAHAVEEASARDEARRDPLTGLANRRAFDEAIESQLAEAERRGVPLALVMLDIEDFKQINDDYGMSAGDRCLRLVARTIEDTIRTPDLCFRWGGDEFALLLLGQTVEGAASLKRRLREAIASTCKRPDGSPMAIRFAIAESADEPVAEELVTSVGLAMTTEKAHKLHVA